MLSRNSARVVRSNGPLHCFRKFQSSQPLAKKGQYPVYDEALSVLQTHGVLSSHIQNIETFRNGQADFSKEAFQKLGLEHFIKYRRDPLVTFAKQRHIFTDFFPIADLNAEIHLASEKGDLIEFCKEYQPALVANTPQFHLQVYHPDERLYTFLFLDGDYPYEAVQRSKEHVLWMITNWKLSASCKSGGDEVHSYLPPHPTRGTGKHRFISFLLEQPGPLVVTPPRDMGVWEFIRANALQPRGLHLFYAQWDPSVSSVFSTYLNQREPVFIDLPEYTGDGLEKNTYAAI